MFLRNLMGHLPLTALQLVAVLVALVVATQWKTQESLSDVGQPDLVTVVHFSIYASEEALNPQQFEAAEPFRDLKQNYFNLGAKEYAVLRLEVSTEQVSALAGQLISIKRNNIRRPLYLYYAKAGQWYAQELQKSTGDGKYLQTAIPNDLELPRLYLGISGKYQRGVLSINSPEEYLHSLRMQAWLSGVYYGLLLLAVIGSLLLYWRLAKVVFAHYALLLTSMGVWLLAGEGWLSSFSAVVAAQPFFTANALGLCFFALFAAFSKSFLQLQQINRRLYMLLTSCQVLHLGLWVGYVFFFQQLAPALYQMFYALALLNSLVILLASVFAAVLAVKQQRQQASFFLLALLLMASVSLWLGLSISGMIDFAHNWHLLQLASVLEVCIFTLGLMVWFKQEKAEIAQLRRELELVSTQLQDAQFAPGELEQNMQQQLVPATLTRQVAQVIALLDSAVCIKAEGNYSLVLHNQGGKIVETLVDCNLLHIEKALGSKRVLRCHKSYLVLMGKKYQLVRRSSADFDLVLQQIKIPVGRKLLTTVRRELKCV